MNELFVKCTLKMRYVCCKYHYKNAYLIVIMSLNDPQALDSFKKYMPPPLPYFKVNICPLPLPHFASIFFAY